MMNWTTETPVDEGYYWWRSETNTHPVIVEIQQYSDEWKILQFGDDLDKICPLADWLNHFSGCEFAGPLPPPTEQ